MKAGEWLIFDTLWHSPVSVLDSPVVTYQRPAGIKLFSTSALQKCPFKVIMSHTQIIVFSELRFPLSIVLGLLFQSPLTKQI